jgi:Zn-dependent membrane protease YugP
MPFIFGDPTFILLIPVMILALWAQMCVSSVYKRYHRVASAQGITGARKVLHAAALTYVAATAVALIHLLRLIILRGDRV